MAATRRLAPLLTLIAAAAAASASNTNHTRVHVLSTICGKDYVAKTLPMLRSLLWHRTGPLSLHIIADRPAKRELERVFADGWGVSELDVDYIQAENHMARVEESMPANFFTNMGSCRARETGTLRLFAPEILPSVEKVIVVDTGDVVLLDDIRKLWTHFDNFGSDHIFGASKEQARWYYRLTDTGSDARMPWNRNQRWYDKGWEGTFERHGINAGVLLLHLQRMRRTGWLKFAQQLVKEGSKRRPDGSQLTLFGNNGEQDVYNYAVVRHELKHKIVYKLPCQWNVQLIGSGLCLRPVKVAEGLDDFNCTCMPPKLLHGNGGSFAKHMLGQFYALWRDNPPALSDAKL